MELRLWSDTEADAGTAGVDTEPLRVLSSWPREPGEKGEANPNAAGRRKSRSNEVIDLSTLGQLGLRFVGWDALHIYRSQALERVWFEIGLKATTELLQEN